MHYLTGEHRRSYVQAVIQSQVACATQRESGIRGGSAAAARTPPADGVPTATLFPFSLPRPPYPPVCQSVSLSVRGASEVKNCPGCTKAATPCLIDVGISLRVYVSSVSVFFYFFIYFFISLFACTYSRGCGGLGPCVTSHCAR